jgi:hypothetical protein
MGSRYRKMKQHFTETFFLFFRPLPAIGHPGLQPWPPRRSGPQGAPRRAGHQGVQGRQGRPRLGGAQRGQRVPGPAGHKWCRWTERRARSLLFFIDETYICEQFVKYGTILYCSVSCHRFFVVKNLQLIVTQNGVKRRSVN